jgi:hypothetical protein
LALAIVPFAERQIWGLPVGGASTIAGFATLTGMPMPTLTAWIYKTANPKDHDLKKYHQADTHGRRAKKKVHQRNRKGRKK